MKLLKLFVCFVIISPTLAAQEEYSSIEVNITDNTEKVLEIKQYEHWADVIADTTFQDLNHRYIIRDKKGRLLKPKLENQVIRSVSKKPHVENILFAGLKGNNEGDAKVTMSMDFGQSWTYLNQGKSLSKEAEDVQTIESSPHQKNIIYAGTWKNGLFKSHDSGNTFMKVDNFPSSDVRAIIFHPEDKQHLLIATTSHGVVETLNNGKTWEFKEIEYQKSNFRSLWKLVQSPYNPNELYALTIGQGLHKSEDFGQNWKKIIDEPKVIFFGLGFKNENEIWCSSTDFQTGKLYYSMDSGSKFELHEDQLDDIISSFAKVNKTGSQFYLGGQKGLYLLSNNKIEKSTIALPFSEIANLLEVSNKLLIATWGNGLIIE